MGETARRERGTARV